jgi:hypothetical protein
VGHSAPAPSDLRVSESYTLPDFLGWTFLGWTRRKRCVGTLRPENEIVL